MPMKMPKELRDEVTSYLNYKEPDQKTLEKKASDKTKKEDTKHHERLKPFIEKYRKQGYDDKDIKKVLTDNKWPASEVDKALKKI